uniref:BHLH domain-containing protein n=1 Tax=Steinernema glaseri TaxID=37863 RepID=A0A1I7ZTN9_9BILA
MPKVMGYESHFSSPSPPPYPMERKLKKPLMEKRRRERMNKSLYEMKELLMNIDPNDRSKFEKADILEMAVHSLRALWQQVSASGQPSSPVVNRMYYQEGFNACANTVSQYLSHTVPGPMSSPQAQQFHQGLYMALQQKAMCPPPTLPATASIPPLPPAFAMKAIPGTETKPFLLAPATSSQMTSPASLSEDSAYSSRQSSPHTSHEQELSQAEQEVDVVNADDSTPDLGNQPPSASTPPVSSSTSNPRSASSSPSKTMWRPYS